MAADSCGEVAKGGPEEHVTARSLAGICEPDRTVESGTDIPVGDDGRVKVRHNVDEPPCRSYCSQGPFSDMDRKHDTLYLPEQRRPTCDA
ncbi:hypothetical protein GCM10009872_54610 [Actinopolymorpha rutila]